MKKGFLGNLKDTVAGAAQATVSATISTKDRAVSTATYWLGSSAPVPAPVHHEVEEGRIDPNSASAALMREIMRQGDLERAQARACADLQTVAPAAAIEKPNALNFSGHRFPGNNYRRVLSTQQNLVIHAGSAPVLPTPTAEHLPIGDANYIIRRPGRSNSDAVG